MNLHIKLNLNSVRKYPDGTFGAQVITSDADDNHAFYACKVKRTAPFEVELDRSNVHEFIDSRWQTATVNDALAKQLTSSMRRFVSSYAHLFTKDVSEGRDGKLFGMWTDAVVSIADKSGKHKLKVGDKIFESKDTISLLGMPSARQRIACEPWQVGGASAHRVRSVRFRGLRARCPRKFR